MKKTVAIGMSPDTERKDVLYALRTIFSPWVFFQNNNITALENWFRQYFKVTTAVSFVSGRAALYAILKSLGIKAGDEVILQSFTCVVVPNAILKLGATPVYVDVSKTLTMDPVDLQKMITKKSKVIIVQHTFGIPTDMNRVTEIAKNNNLFIIEDAAHTIGGTLNGKKLGSIGDAGFFSFGRDKAFSAVFGGIAVTNNKTIGRKLKALQQNLENPSYFWTLQQLFHPIAFSLILPTYSFFSFGKAVLAVFQKLHLLSFPVVALEKKGKQPDIMLKRMQNSLAGLALLQLKRIKRYNASREAFVKLYENTFRKSKFILPYKEIAPLLRFPMLSEKRNEIITEFRKQGIYLGNWYTNGVDPKGSDFAKILYNPKKCPKAESYAKKVFNLPTYPTLTLKDAKKIVNLLKPYA